MRTPELEARRRASAAVSRLFFVTLRAEMGELEQKDISAVLPPLLVAMVVRLNDDAGKPPASVSEIARMTGIPRATARRYLTRLIEQGVLIRKDDGVVGNDNYLAERLDAEYFKVIVKAIRAAALELENYPV